VWSITDNQPDFAWIMPRGEKFVQVFMPYKLIGPPKNASRDVVLNLETTVEIAKIGVYGSSSRRVQIELWRENKRVFQKEVDLAPETACIEEIAVPGLEKPQSLTLRLLDGQTELISFTPPDGHPASAAVAAGLPEIASTGALLNGLHLEQYRHATNARPYYEEALRLIRWTAV
jgi:hypothetical protein